MSFGTSDIIRVNGKYIKRPRHLRLRKAVRAKSKNPDAQHEFARTTSKEGSKGS
jgi:hypothetical protein